MKKRAIVAGYGSLAIQIAEWFCTSDEYTLVEVVPNMPEPTWTDSIMAWAEKKGIPVVASGHYQDIAALGQENEPIDLVFSVFYNRIFKQWFLDRCTNILNLHLAPLPRYRGVSPINWALKNNESKHGVTIHEVSPGIDDGPIYAQLEFSIYPEFDEVIDVYNRALAYAWVLFCQTMPMLDKIVPRPQDERFATYYRAKQKEFLQERRDFTKQRSAHQV